MISSNNIHMTVEVKGEVLYQCSNENAWKYLLFQYSGK